MNLPSYRYVDFLWNDEEAAGLAGDEVRLLLYRSNLLGADLRITNYGGGNTSCRTMEVNPLSGEKTEVMWIKGSGGDLGTLSRTGLAALYTSRLKRLKKIYKGLEYEDEMVAMYRHCLYDLESKSPSIDTALHGLLPHKHIDHLHPDAVIAIAAARDGQKITREIWGDQMGWIPWQRPGFDLGIKLEKCYDQSPAIRGIILGGHGLFTWGETSRECYVNSLEVIEKASEYCENKIREAKIVFGGPKIEEVSPENRRKQATRIGPILRGLCSESSRMIGHFTDDSRVLEFVNSRDCKALALLGTSCPDHFLRTKIKPLILDLDPGEQLTDVGRIKSRLNDQFRKYRSEYGEYYQHNKRPDSPSMRDPNPVVILYPGIGLFTFAKNKQTARVASEFYINAIQVMRSAEAISRYTALSSREAFNIEYWQLEEAKLRRQPPEKPLSRKIALITGAAGGIGYAIAQKLADEGAHVVLADISDDVLQLSEGKIPRDQLRSTICDVTDPNSIEEAIELACLEFGGLDILVHSAGLAVSKPIEKTTSSDWDILQDVMVKGQFQLARAAVEVMRLQELGGDIIHIASKNGLVAGPNNVAYGTAKAAQQHMTRLLAAELGNDRIRVNTVNPDAVIIGSKIWQGKWAEGRSKAYGVSVAELPDYYAKRNLLHEIILPEDIANGVFALVTILNKSTGNSINIDGGMPEAFPR